MTYAQSVQVRRGFVDGPWGQLHYREAGAGAPLLFLHQSPSSSLSWVPALDAFAPYARCLAPDTPGYGDSAPPPAIPTLAAYCDAFITCLDALGVARTPVVGHHTGATFAAALAWRHPDRISRVVLSHPPVFAPQDAERLRTRWAPRPIDAAGQFLADTWTGRGQALASRLSAEAVFDDYVDELRNWPRGHWAPSLLADTDLAGELARVPQPVLVIHNPRDAISRMKPLVVEALPAARYVSIDNARTSDSFAESLDVLVPLIMGFVLEN